jgi:hypothetical protein
MTVNFLFIMDNSHCIQVYRFLEGIYVVTACKAQKISFADTIRTVLNQTGPAPNLSIQALN